MGLHPDGSLFFQQRSFKSAQKASEMGLGMSKTQVLEKVGHLAKELNLKTPFVKNKPGKDWWYGFKSRNPEVTLRSPEKLSSIRGRGLNAQSVG